MPGTIVVVHHDVVVVVDPDVLIRRAIRDRLQLEHLHVLAYGCWHDAVRQLARVVGRLKALPLPEAEPPHDPIELWHLLQHDVCPPHRGLSVLSAVSLRASRRQSSRKNHPLQLLAHELRECHQLRRQAVQPDDALSITKAEHRVIELLREGRSNKAIADLLCLSQRTVESHLHRLFRKLKVSNRTELAMAVA